jgi:hypothetical protein
MDVSTLVAFLAPLVPYLVKGGQAAAEEVGKKVGGGVWDRASAIWHAISPKVASAPGLSELVEDLQKNPADEAARGALVYHLQKLFAKDATLKAAVEQIWTSTDKAAVQTVIASGERAVAAGGDVTGTVITGNFGASDRPKRS